MEQSFIPAAPIRRRAHRNVILTLPVLAAIAGSAWPSADARVADQTPAQPPAAAPDPTPVLAAAREALGGEKRLSAVKTFVATGRTRQLQGDNLVPIEFEISCELPDKCIRRDEIPARESGPTTIGFSGDELIQIPVPPSALPPRAGAPPLPAGTSGGPTSPGRGGPPPAQMAALRVATTKQDFARLWLGMFGASFTSFSLVFTHAGAAEAPQGQADVLDAKGPANFAARFFIFRETHLPIMLSWQGPEPGRGSGTPVENRLYYADYRDVEGLKFPFRLRRAVGADTVEETTFDRFRINARIDPRKFEVRK